MISDSLCVKDCDYNCLVSSTNVPSSYRSDLFNLGEGLAELTSTERNENRRSKIEKATIKV